MLLSVILVTAVSILFTLTHDLRIAFRKLWSWRLILRLTHHKSLPRSLVVSLPATIFSKEKTKRITLASTSFPTLYWLFSAFNFFNKGERGGDGKKHEYTLYYCDTVRWTASYSNSLCWREIELALKCKIVNILLLIKDCKWIYCLTFR